MTASLALRRLPLTFPEAVAARLRQSDAQIFVTGPNGWMGLALLEMLRNALGAEWTTRVRTFGRRSHVLTLHNGAQIAVEPFTAMTTHTGAPVLLFHLAFATRDKVAEMSLADYIEANRQLSALVASTAALLPLKGVFIPSSGAVYRADGALDHDLHANPYGVLKLEDEHRFMELAAAKNAAAVVARVFNLSGPYINKPELYVLTTVVLAALRGEPIRLKAAQPVYRSYIYIADLLGATMGHLTAPQIAAQPLCFDTAGEQAIEVGALASLTAQLLGVGSIGIERPDWQEGVPSCYVGDRLGFLHACRAQDITPAPLDWQVLDTAAALAQEHAPL